MTTRNFQGYLKDILLYCEKIQGFMVGCTYESFNSDELRLFSVIRCLEVIGEASKHIPTEIKNQYPEISWKTIAGMRDYLVHDYMGVNNQLVWKTALHDIPELRLNIQKILNDYE